MCVYIYIYIYVISKCNRAAAEGAGGGREEGGQPEGALRGDDGRARGGVRNDRGPRG